MNLLVNFFEGCNEGIMGKETEGRGSTVEVLTVEYVWVSICIWCMLDWIIGFCRKTAEIHFLGLSCSIFSLFTFYLENSTLSADIKPSLENNSSNLLISIGVVIKITVYI